MCSGVEDLHFFLFSPAKTGEGVCADIRARSLQLSLPGTHSSQFHQLSHIAGMESNDSYLIELRYQKVQGCSPRRGKRPPYSRTRNNWTTSGTQKSIWTKRCIVCKKKNYWSSEHTPEEQRATFEKIKKIYPSKDE